MGEKCKMGSDKKIELNISSEKAFSKLSENQKIIEIGRTVRKLLSFKELLSNLGFFRTRSVLIANFECS